MSPLGVATRFRRLALALSVTAVFAAAQAGPAAGFEYLTEWNVADPEGLDVGPDNAVYVGEYENQFVRRYSSTGTFLSNVGTFGSGGDGVGDLAINPANGDIYFTDTTGNRVVQTTAAGAFIRDWGKNAGDGTPGDQDGEFNLPLGIAIGNDSVYVTDQQNHRVQQFTLTGDFVRDWAGFNNPNEIALAPSGDVYVTDNDNKVQQFTSSGGFIREWGSPGTDSGEFQSLSGVAVEASGDVWASDNARIQEFTSTGSFIRKFGNNNGDGTTGSGAGEFDGGFNMAFDCRGNLYVADFNNNRVQKFGEPGAGEPPCTAEPPPAKDSTAPISFVLFDRTQHLDSITVFIQVNEASTVVGSGRVRIPKVQTAKIVRFKQVRRRAPAVLGVKLRFKLRRKSNRAALRALTTRRRLKARLLVTVTDAAGNAKTTPLRLKIKR